jgi:hypothetical protein
MAEIKVRFVYSEAEALQAGREVSRAVLPMVARLPWIGGAAFLGGLGYLFTTHRPLLDGLSVLICGGCLLALPWLTRRALKKQFRQNPSRDCTIGWTFTEQSLANETEGATASFTWKMLIEVKETAAGFLLFPQPRLAHWIPKHAFASAADVDAFRGLVRQNASLFSGGQLGPVRKPQPSASSRWIASGLMAGGMASMAWVEFRRSADWESALPMAIAAPIVAGIFILVSSCFPENRNPRTRIKIITWIGASFIASAILLFRG